MRSNVVPFSFLRVSYTESIRRRLRIQKLSLWMISLGILSSFSYVPQQLHDDIEIPPTLSPKAQQLLVRQGFLNIEALRSHLDIPN
jgi:hypothetical protein